MSLHYTAIFSSRGTIATVLSLLFKRCTARRDAKTIEPTDRRNRSANSIRRQTSVDI